MTIAATWRTTRILHAALLMSLVMYGVVVVIVTGQPRTAPSPSTTMAYGLGAAALILQLIAIPTVRAKMLPRLERVSDGRRWDFDAEVPEPARPLFARVRVALIVTWALCEATAVFGLVAAFLYHEAVYFWPFGVVGAGSMLVYAPTRALFEAVLRAAERG